MKGLFGKKGDKIVNFFPANIFHLRTPILYEPNTKLAIPIAVLLSLLEIAGATADCLDSISLVARQAHVLTN